MLETIGYHLISYRKCPFQLQPAHHQRNLPDCISLLEPSDEELAWGGIDCWHRLPQRQLHLLKGLVNYRISIGYLQAIQCLNVVAAACFETGWTCWTRWTRTWYRAFRIRTLRGRGLTQRQHRPFVARLLRHCLGSRFALRSLTLFFRSFRTFWTDFTTCLVRK